MQIGEIFTIVFASTTALLGFLTFFYKKKADIRNRRFDIYHKSLTKIDELNKRLSTMFRELLTVDLNRILEKILQNPADFNSTIVELQNLLYEKISESMKIVSQTYSEFNALRLIASKETLTLLDSYQEIAIRQARLNSEIINSIKLVRPDISREETIAQISNSTLTKQMASLQDESNRLRSDLEKQMRKDLGEKD